jgi:Xaa-Pro aminopeptidase
MSEGLFLWAASETNSDQFAASMFLTSDAFAWLEVDGRRIGVVTGFDVELARRTSRATELLTREEMHAAEAAAGASSAQLRLAEALNVCRHAGVDAVRVPPWFPLGVAEHLRDAGIAVRIDAGEMASRRLVKDRDQMAAVQSLTERAMGLIREALRGCDVAGDGGLVLDGRPLTSERLHALVRGFWVEQGCDPVPPVCAGGAQAADPHESGHGPLRAGEPIVCDLFPRHLETRLYGDMTRTFCVGEPAPEVAEAHAACADAIRLAIGAARPGMPGIELHMLIADFLHSRGYATQFHPGPDDAWTFSHGLGHGVGLDVHEPPSAGRGGTLEFAPGMTLTIEPGLYRAGVGGIRIEDLVIFTDTGVENLNTMDYDLVV